MNKVVKRISTFLALSSTLLMGCTNNNIKVKVETDLDILLMEDENPSPKEIYGDDFLRMVVNKQDFVLYF